MVEKYEAFTTSLMGSMPRSQEMVEAIDKYRAGDINSQVFEALVDKEMAHVVRLQEETGIDVITSGEISRDNYMSFVADKVPGIEMMSVEEIAHLTDDAKENFEESLKKRDVSDTGMNNPVCAAKIDTNAHLDCDELGRLQGMTDHPIKATVPSPYLLTRSSWVTGVSDRAYENREELGQDMLELVLNEVKRLVKMGIEVIQLDDPILAEVVFTEDTKPAFY